MFAYKKPSEEDNKEQAGEIIGPKLQRDPCQLVKGNIARLYSDIAHRMAVQLSLLPRDYHAGISPTEREFTEATLHHKTRLIFVKGSEDKNRDPKLQAMILRIGKELIRRRYSSTSELIASVYAALVQDLEMRDLLRNGPFDAAPCFDATLADLNEERIATFLGLARRGRDFPLSESTPSLDVLTHLNLMNKGRFTHAALLLFGKKPQRFLISSEVKCIESIID